MKNYTRNMFHNATYWPPGENDGYGGLNRGDPENIQCRWQETAELFRDAEGSEVTSSAVIYPEKRLRIGGLLALGHDADQSGAREIRQVSATSDLTAGYILHKVWL